MASAILGLVLDSSVLVAAERAKRTTPDIIQHIRAAVGDVPIIICALTVAELAHGIHRANTPERRQQRRQFLDELKATVPVHPVTEATAEIIAKIGSEKTRDAFIARDVCGRRHVLAIDADQSRNFERALAGDADARLANRARAPDRRSVLSRDSRPQRLR